MCFDFGGGVDEIQGSPWIYSDPHRKPLFGNDFECAQSALVLLVASIFIALHISAKHAASRNPISCVFALDVYSALVSRISIALTLSSLLQNLVF